MTSVGVLSPEEIDIVNRTVARSSRPLRVMLLISSLERGGAERQVVHLANRLDRRKFEVHVCTLSKATPLAKDLERPDRFHSVPKLKRFDWRLVFRTARLMRKLQIDLVHAFMFDAEIVARIGARLAGVPTVIASERNTDYDPPILHRCAHRVTRRHVDVLVANSEAGARFRRRVMPLAGDRIRIVANGVDACRFRPMNKPAAKKCVGLDPQHAVVGMVASFKRQKNHGDFFRAAALVASRLPSAQFVCVGDTLRDNLQGSRDYRDEMCALMRELGLARRVRFFGSRDDMPFVFNALDVTVLPSLREGTSNVLLESMGCGTPVVVNDIADHQTLVREGVTGYIVPTHDIHALANRIELLLADDDRRLFMGKQARAHVIQNYSLDSLAVRMGAVYEESIMEKTGLLPWSGI